MPDPEIAFDHLTPSCATFKKLNLGIEYQQDTAASILLIAIQIALQTAWLCIESTAATQFHEFKFDRCNKIKVANCN